MNFDKQWLTYAQLMSVLEEKETPAQIKSAISNLLETGAADHTGCYIIVPIANEWNAYYMRNQTDQQAESEFNISAARARTRYFSKL